MVLKSATTKQLRYVRRQGIRDDEKSRCLIIIQVVIVSPRTAQGNTTIQLPANRMNDVFVPGDE